MNNSNITDNSFWNGKYSINKPRYSFHDPFYGKKGLLARTLEPWLKDAGDVLEIGCGSSRYLMFFNLVAGIETYGIDFSREGILKLESMASDFGIKHKLQYGDMFEEELEGRKFDVVFHSGLIEHFTDLGLVFRRCRFFCKEDGLMIFLMPYMQNMAWKWHRWLCPENYKAHIRYTGEDILQALSPGFTVLATRLWGYPQVYAGGPPESFPAKLLKYLNMALVLMISLSSSRYKGSTNPKWASTLLFVCKAK